PSSPPSPGSSSPGWSPPPSPAATTSKSTEAASLETPATDCAAVTVYWPGTRSSGLSSAIQAPPTTSTSTDCEPVARNVTPSARSSTLSPEIVTLTVAPLMGDSPVMAGSEPSSYDPPFSGVTMVGAPGTTLNETQRASDSPPAFDCVAPTVHSPKPSSTSTDQVPSS